MIRRPPRSTLFPSRRSSDLTVLELADGALGADPEGWRMGALLLQPPRLDRKSTRLNSSHVEISYAVFCLKKKKTQRNMRRLSAGSKTYGRLDEKSSRPLALK